jgi:hypothetical protein
MTGQCCVAGPAGAHRLARGMSAVAGSILAVALFVFLPKCPLCLARWLTVATGISFSAACAGLVRAGVVVVWVAALTAVLWRRASASPDRSHEVRSAMV